MRLVTVVILIILSFPVWSQNSQSFPKFDTESSIAVSGNVALLRGLDTITGATLDITIPVNEEAKFGRLTVSVQSCRYLPENPSLFSYAFVTVYESNKPQPLFRAWMIASAPALSAIEHPRYDIWLIRCNAETDTSSNG